MIIKSYYRFSFIIASIAVFQILLFVLFGISFLPQNIISGQSIVSGAASSFKPEVFDLFPRAIGLSKEPSHFGVLVLPSAYISLKVLLQGAVFEINNKIIALTIIIALILSFSLIGYLGLLLSLISLFKQTIRFNVKKIFSASLLFVGLMFFIMQTRIGDKLTSFFLVGGDITGTQYTSSDQSSFALFSNLLVALVGLKSSYFLGTGLNTHVITYDGSIGSIFSYYQIPNELNKEDAGSLFVRIISEFGIPGFILFAVFLIKLKLNQKTESSVGLLNGMCYVTLLTYCFRSGQYLNVFFFFILALYYYTYLESNKCDVV